MKAYVSVCRTSLNLHLYHMRVTFVHAGPYTDDNMQMPADLLNLLSSILGDGEYPHVGHAKNASKAILPIPNN